MTRAIGDRQFKSPFNIMIAVDFQNVFVWTNIEIIFFIFNFFLTLTHQYDLKNQKN
jgi:hypothetical protein